MNAALEHLLPEPPRLDRHETYIGILIYVWLASVGIYLLPIGSGTIGAMDPSQQKLLAICMFLGSTLCMMGSAMGTPTNLRITKPFRWVLKSRPVRWLRRQRYAPLPTRHCYRLGVAGLTANIVAFGFFTGQLLTGGSIIGSMTGLLPPILVVTWFRKARKLHRIANQMDREYEALKLNAKEAGAV